MDNTRVMTLTESSYVGLVIHIAIAINRILKDEVIDTDASWQQGLVEDADYHLAEQIVEELEEEFEIEIPAVEVSYICLHIKEQSMKRSSGTDRRSMRSRTGNSGGFLMNGGCF